MITEFGKVVRKSRIEAGISMVNMAKAIGVSPSFASATEKGMKKIPIPYAENLKKYFYELGVCYEGDILVIAKITNLMMSHGIEYSHACLINSLLHKELNDDVIDEIFEITRDCKCLGGKKDD